MTVQIGEVVEGRCVSSNLKMRGRVAAIFQPQLLSGDFGPRYQIADVAYIDHPDWSPAETAFVFA